MCVSDEKYLEYTFHINTAYAPYSPPCQASLFFQKMY